MTDTKIESHLDLKSLQKYIDRVSEGVDFRLSLKLERVLAKAFKHTQDRTHIISGSLKASGKSSSDYDKDGWGGKIEYGGEHVRPATPGPPFDPVDYAVYEAARGPEHDPLHGLEVFEAQFENALDEYYGGLTK